ncbi:hypothetical protein CONCODRAFT_6706, partial [Conidiobolus coronatus NRRL 28638]
LYVISVINSFILVIPCWVSTYCYSVIGIKSYRKLNQIKREALASNDENLLKVIRKQKYNLIAQLVVVLTVFNIVYIPLYITMVLRIVSEYRRTPIAEAIMMKLAEISRAIDPLITVIFQPELSHEFKAFIIKTKVRLRVLVNNLFE